MDPDLPEEEMKNSREQSRASFMRRDLVRSRRVRGLGLAYQQSGAFKFGLFSTPRERLDRWSKEIAAERDDDEFDAVQLVWTRRRVPRRRQGEGSPATEI